MRRSELDSFVGILLKLQNGCWMSFMFPIFMVYMRKRTKSYQKHIQTKRRERNEQKRKNEEKEEYFSIVFYM